MPKNYIKKINNGVTDLYIKDEEARNDISDIKSYIKGSLRRIGTSSTAVTETFTGKWQIDGIFYAGEFINISFGEDAPVVSFVKDVTLNEGYESVDDPVRMIGFRAYNVTSGSGIPDVIYTIGSNKASLTINDVYLKGSSWVTIRSIYANCNLNNYSSPTTQQASELRDGDVVYYNNKEFVWGLFGWRELGDMSSLGSLAFKNSASGSITPHGTVAISNSSANTLKLETTTIRGIGDDTDIMYFIAGTLPSLSYNSATETLTLDQGTLPLITRNPTAGATLISIPNRGKSLKVATGKTTDSDEDGDSVVVDLGNPTATFTGTAETVIVS